MDGKEEALMDSIALTMSINPNTEIDFLTSASRFEYLAQRIVDFFGEKDSLPDVVLVSEHQVALENGSVFNLIGSGRDLHGRKPTLIVMDEGYEDQYAYLSGASIVHLSREDIGFA